MTRYILLLLGLLRNAFRSKSAVSLENLALRQQLNVLGRSVRRPRITSLDRLFWVGLRKLWAGWSRCLLIVKPETVVAWHRKGFKLFWRLKSRKPGRPRVSRDVRNLIRRICRDNPTWGAPRILAELEKLGIRVCEATVAKYMLRGGKPPSDSWRSFLRNQAKAIRACDFFVVPTVTFRLLFVFVVMSHDRRKILHFNVTSGPSAAWTSQQIVNAFPYDSAP